MTPRPSRTVPQLASRVQAAIATSSGVDIPSSTVVSIGLGFVACAFALLGLLFGLRLLRLHRQVTRAHREGRNEVTFQTVWRDEGGFFGFLTGLGSEPLSIGAGGAPDFSRIRRILEEYAKITNQDPKVPVMWEVGVSERGRMGDLEVKYESISPLSMSQSGHPPYADRAKQPEDLDLPDLAFNILIAFPSDPSDKSNLKCTIDGEEYDELPEVAIGVTKLSPIVSMIVTKNTKPKSTADEESVDTDPGDMLKDGLGKEKGEIHELEYVGDVSMDSGDSSSRRARWEKLDAGKWRIEGMG